MTCHISCISTYAILYIRPFPLPNHYDIPRAPGRYWYNKRSETPGEFHEGDVIKIVIDSNQGEVKISFMDKKTSSWLWIPDYTIMEFEMDEEVDIILSIYNDEEELGWCGFEKSD